MEREVEKMSREMEAKNEDILMFLLNVTSQKQTGQHHLALDDGAGLTSPDVSILRSIEPKPFISPLMFISSNVFLIRINQYGPLSVFILYLVLEALPQGAGLSSYEYCLCHEALLLSCMFFFFFILLVLFKVFIHYLFIYLFIFHVKFQS